MSKVEITEVIEEHGRGIFKYENVVSVKIARKRKANRTLNPKRSKIFSAESNCGTASMAGKATKDLCLVVLVEKKVPKAEFLSRDIVPEEIDRRKGDVIEVGRIEAFPYNGCHRPAFLGCNIGYTGSRLQGLKHKIAFWWSVVGLFGMTMIYRNSDGLRELKDGIINIKRGIKNDKIF